MGGVFHNVYKLCSGPIPKMIDLGSIVCLTEFKRECIRPHVAVLPLTLPESLESQGFSSCSVRVIAGYKVLILEELVSETGQNQNQVLNLKVVKDLGTYSSLERNQAIQKAKAAGSEGKMPVFEYVEKIGRDEDFHSYCEIAGVGFED